MMRIHPRFESNIHETMTGCCDTHAEAAARQGRQRGTLQVVLGINVVMFVIIAGAALYSHSSALLAESFDNFGDAVTYALSLYAITRSAGTKARVALFKGGLILLAALVVAVQAVYKIFVPVVPIFEVMGVFSLLGLAANGTCFWLLWRHRNEDVNMSSVWECSRNDIAAGAAVFLTAGAVWLTGSGWPDILVALALAAFLMRSGLRVLGSARAELEPTPP